MIDTGRINQKLKGLITYKVWVRKGYNERKKGNEVTVTLLRVYHFG